MEVKKSKRPSFSLWLIPASCGAMLGLYYLTAYLLVPLIGEIFPSVHNYFYALNEEPENRLELLRFDAVVQDLCSLIAFVPGTAISFIFSKRARRDFIEDTKCLVGYREGLKYHIKKYWLADLVFLAVLYLCLAIPYFAKIWILYLVPLCGTAYKRFGFIFGLFAFVAIGYPLSLCGAYFGQKKWRADYFSE